MGFGFEASNQNGEEYDFSDAVWNQDDSIANTGANVQNNGNAGIHAVSGTGIIDNDDDDEVSGELVSDLLKNLNAGNTEAYKKEHERLIEEQRIREEADAQARKTAQEKLLYEQYEKEKAERERIRQEEEEEERRLAEELEAKRKANPLFKLKESAAEIAAKNAEKMKTRAEESKAAKEAKKIENEKKAKEAKETKEIEKVEEINKQNAAKEPDKEEKVLKKSDVKKDKKPKKEKTDNSEPTKSTQPDFEYLATHDKLTGMKNLTAFEMDTQSLSTKNLVVIFLDINDLKLTNDEMGHAMGNKLITTVSNSLANFFPEEVYRIGGDEFIVLYHPKKPGNAQKEIEEKIADFKSAMKNAAKEDENGLSYSVSIGYAFGDGKQDIAALQEKADQAMYENKKAYKASQKKSTPKKKDKEKQQTPPSDYDSLLSNDQRMLKTVIRDNHNPASEDSTEKILREIQSRSNEIIAILITNSTFDHLFVLQDINNFLNLVAEMDNLIDYSYIYAVFESGTQFYGIDEYFDEVTDLLKEIGRFIKTSPYVSDKELLKIKGINIFKHIYMD